LDGIQQILMSDGLGEELDCAGFHGPNRHWHVGVATDENHRQAHICFDEFIVKI
jgi:hypothetical protein